MKFITLQIDNKGITYDISRAPAWAKIKIWWFAGRLKNADITRLGKSFKYNCMDLVRRFGRPVTGPGV